MQFAPAVEQWRGLVTRYFGAANADLALAIINLESSGNPSAHNTKGEDSRGLGQINVGPGANTDLAGLNLYDPETNIRAMKTVYDRAGWGAWSTFSAAKALLLTAGELPGNVTPGMPEPGQPTGPAYAPIPAEQIVPPTVPSFGNIQDAIGALAKTIAALPQSAVGPFVDFGNRLASELTYLGQANVWKRVGLVAFGGILTLIGLILFALSFINPKPIIKAVAA